MCQPQRRNKKRKIPESIKDDLSIINLAIKHTNYAA
jgi:hypothetical protein